MLLISSHASLALLFYFLAGTLAMPLWMKLAIAQGDLESNERPRAGRRVDLLEREHAHYQVLPHRKTTTLTQAAEACDLALGQLVRAVILVDGRGLLMAVLPADHVIDFNTLCRQLHRDLESELPALLLRLPLADGRTGRLSMTPAGSWDFGAGPGRPVVAT